MISAGTPLVRVYNPESHNTQPRTFRTVGPIHRFDHHRRTAPASLIDAGMGLYDDPDRAVAYVARKLSCCLVEIFGETLTIARHPWHLAILRPSRALELLDLRGRGAMGAGSVAAIAKVPDRSLTQAWSRWFYEQEHAYKPVDGLLFFGAYNDEESIALFERCAGTLTCDSREVIPLTDPRLQPIIDSTALDHGMLVI